MTTQSHPIPSPSTNRNRFDRLRRLISVFFLVIFCAWATWYVHGHIDEFKVIARIPLTTLIALFLLFGGILYLNGIYTQYIMSAFDIPLRRMECSALSVASTAGNYITFFRGGAGIRAVYLKINYRFSFASFVSTLSAMYLMYFIVNGIMGLAGLGLLVLEGKKLDLLLAGIFFGLTIFGLLVILAPIRFPEFKRFPFREISKIINGWEIVRKNRLLVFQLFFNTALCTGLLMAQTKLAFSAYGVHLTWGGVMCFAATKSISLLASITPGALGVVEWASVYLGKTLDYTAAQALMAQGLMRAITLTTLIVLGPIATRYLGKRLKEGHNGEENH